jgi:hypothetical protein
MSGLKFTDAEWQGVEAACGWALSETLRDNILRVTQEFLSLETYQQTGGKVVDVKVVLESYDKAASRFFNAIFDAPSGQFAASTHAHDLIELNSKRLGKSSESLFDEMLALLRAFHIACNSALKQLRELQISSSGTDNAWRLWIRWLSELINETGLPSSGSKDVGAKSKSDDQSAFTEFVWQLQRCLPEEVRRHTASKQECAASIRDAQSLALRGKL